MPHPDAGRQQLAESHEPAVGTVVGGARLPGDRNRQTPGLAGGSSQDRVSQQVQHRFGGLPGDDLIHAGLVALQKNTIGVFHPVDEMGVDPDPAVGERAEGGRDLLQSDLARSQSGGEIEWDFPFDSEPVRHFDDSLNAHGVGQT